MAIAPKRVLLGGAAAGGLASRAAAVPGIPRQAAAAAATALFSTAPSAPVRLSSLLPSRPRIATSLSQRQAVGGGERRGVRWSSDSAPAGSKIWNFEEVRGVCVGLFLPPRYIHTPMPLCALNSCPQLFPQTKPDQTRPDQVYKLASQNPFKPTD